MIVLLVLAAAGVAWLSISTYLPRVDARFAFLASENPDDVFRETGRELLANEGRLDERAYRRLGDAARRRPLADEPFIFYGMRALAAEDLAAAERLLTEARTRDPREAMARLALMGLYLRTDRVREGSSEVAVLARLVPDGGRLLVPELARLALVPASRDALMQAVGDDPIMADVLNWLVERGVNPDTVLRLASRQPRSSDGSFAPWQQNLLGKLVERGNVARAYELWRSFVGSARAELVYDPEFRGQPGPPPFNWELTASGLGAAELARGGGLELEYFGRRDGALARQLLLLRPGRYRLSFQVEGSASGQGSRILLQLGCRNGDARLLEIPLEGLSYTPRELAGEFTVPAGCEAQWLTFAGQAAEFPNTQRARIAGLTLRPAGG